jgi:hypothetical protein
VRALAILTALLVASPASAGKPTLIALAPASDARRAVAIGPAGQVYQPDGKGAWVRTQAGGVAEELVGATVAGGTVIASARGAPPFKLKRGAWTVLHLGKGAKATLGVGSRALAAVGKTVFALDRTRPQKLTEAPDPIVALAASSAGIVIATDKGLHRLERGAWKPIKRAPKKVRALASDRWALVDRGALDLKTLKVVAWPAGMRVAETTVLGNDLYAVATRGKTVELWTVKRSKLAREEIPLDKPKAIVGIVVDRAGRVAVAVRDGRIALRERGTWTVAEVREELAPPKPGPAPAESK